MKVTLSRLTLCDLIDYTVHGILQARILEWVTFTFSRGSSQPRDQTQVSPISVNSLPAEPPGKPLPLASPLSKREGWSIPLLNEVIKPLSLGMRGKHFNFWRSSPRRAQVLSYLWRACRLWEASKAAGLEHVHQPRMNRISVGTWTTAVTILSKQNCPEVQVPILTKSLSLPVQSLLLSSRHLLQMGHMSSGPDRVWK